MTLRRLLIVVLLELLYVVATRAVLHYFSWNSVEAEAIRTVLRLSTAIAYWYLLKSLILSQTAEPKLLLRPTAIGALILFLAIPFLVGRYDLETGVAVMFALASIPVAIKEEFLFRGIVQNVLAKKVGPLKAIALTSAVFTLWHVGTWELTFWMFSQIFLASIFVGFIYARSGSILAAIAVHAVYDALFSFTPLIPAPLDPNWGFVPLLSAVALLAYWAVAGNGLTVRSDLPNATGRLPLS